MLVKRYVVFREYRYPKTIILPLMHHRILPLLAILAMSLSGCQPNDSTASSSPIDKPETIVFVFAHPDDETTVGPVMAKVGQTDSVYLIIATDGRFGETEHAGIPAGDSLVDIRMKELECSCSSLGIQPPIMLGMQDGLGLNGHGNFYEQVPELKKRLLAEILRLQPDKIITFGPDGDTGHPDHRMVGNLVTEVLLQQGLTDQIDLYFFGWQKAQAEKYSWWELSYVDDSGLDTEIAFSETDEQKANASIRCYVSQFTQEEMAKWIAAEENDPSNKLYFRKFAIEEDLKKEF